MAVTRTDLMSTQTGGTGETIQALPTESASPEQFAANIKAPQPQEVQQPAPVPAQEAPAQAEEVQQQPVAEQPQLSKEELLQRDLGLKQVDVPSGPEPISDADIPNRDLAMAQPEELPDGISIKKFEEAPKQQEEPLFEIKEEPEVQSTVTELPDGISVYNPAEKTKQESSLLNKEYSGTDIKIDDKGKVKTVKAGDEPKADGIYRYPGVDHLLKKEGGKWYRDSNGDGKFELVKDGAQRLKLIEKHAYQGEKADRPDGEYVMPNNPGYVYKKEDGKWSVDFEGKGNYIELTKGDVKARIENLEKNSQPLKSKTLDEINKNIESRVGVVSDFNQNSILTNKGEPVVSETLTFDKATKDYKKPGEKWERYNPDGTLNYNYDPQAAKQKELGLYSDQVNKNIPTEKPDGLYLFPGNKNNYKKEDGKWYIKPNGADKFVPLTQGNVEERIDLLERKAYQPVPLKDFPKTAIYGVKDPLDRYDINKRGDDFIEKLHEDNNNYKSEFYQGSNFANNDLNRIYGDDLTEDQKSGLRQYQEQIKKIIGDGQYDPSKGASISKALKDAQAFFESSKKINQKVVEAYQKDVSLDRLAFENKKRSVYDNLGSSGIYTDSQKLTRDTFEATSDMTEFILNYVDRGSLMYDRKNGGFKFSPYIDQKERQYIEGELNFFLENYNKIQAEKYKEVNDELFKAQKSKGFVKQNIEKLESNLAYFKKNNIEGQDALIEEINRQKNILEKLDNQIDDLELSKGTVFLTKPKETAARVAKNLSGDAKNVFDSMPKDITPKQRFDLFYETLEADNKKFAKDNGIDVQGMASISMRVKDLLDWGGYFSLSDAEKRYLRNLATLKQLAPLYYNNDTGITNESAGFWESFMDSLRNTLLPETSAADSHFLQTEQAAVINQKLKEQGFSDDDLVDKDVLDRMKRRSTVDSLSSEKIGGMLGTTSAIILPLVLTEALPAAALTSVVRLERLVTGIKDASKIADLAVKAENVYNTTLSATKLGRFLKPAIEQGAKFELAGKVFGSTDDELNFLSGLAGGAASEAFSVLLSKLPTAKAIEYVKSAFGEQTPAAINVLAKIGRVGREAVSGGAGETAEETAQELVSVYQSTNNWQDMKRELEGRFGTFDKVQEFVLASFVMGTAFRLIDTQSAKETLDAMPEAKKDQVLDALGAVTDDLNKAENAVNEFTDNKLKQQEIEYRSGVPSATGKAKEQAYDKENKPGVSGEKPVGEEPVEAEPVVEPGKEEARPSGVVQEEQAKVKTTIFRDYGKIKKIKNPKEKKAAIDEFNVEHNNQYKRVESIDNNFNGIFRSLNKLNLVKKEC